MALKARPRTPIKSPVVNDPARDDPPRQMETEEAIRAAERGVIRRTYTVEEAAVILGLSRGAAFNFVRDGTIPSIRLGRRLLIPAAALDRLLMSA